MSMLQVDSGLAHDVRRVFNNCPPNVLPLAPDWLIAAQELPVRLDDLRWPNTLLRLTPIERASPSAWREGRSRLNFCISPHCTTQSPQAVKLSDPERSHRLRYRYRMVIPRGTLL